MRGFLRRHLLPRRHTALLVAIVITFASRPLIADTAGGSLALSLSFLVLLLLALYTVQVDELVGEREVLLAQRRRWTLTGWALAVPAIAERLYILIAPSPQLYLAGLLTWLLVIGFVTWTELRSVVRQREVTRETISMAVSVYLLLGLSWAFLYAVMFQLEPQAFNFGDGPSAPHGPVPDPLHLLPLFVYFSLTTLATIGFGDITPVSLPARYAAVAEGITGQLYLAILVARLVGMYMSRPASAAANGAPRLPEAAQPPDRTR